MLKNNFKAPKKSDIGISVHDWRWSGGPRPPEIMSDHQNILSSGPVDHQII